MWLQVLVLLLCGSYSLSGFISDTLLRTKRQGPSISEKNNAIEIFNNCSCVPYYLCVNGSIITNGQDIITARLAEERGINCYGGQFTGELRCCKHKPGEPPLTTEKPVISVNSTCGQQLLGGITERIYTDDDGDLLPVVGEFPWLVQIFKKDPKSSEWAFNGTGSLIRPSVVLTANHVVRRVKPDDVKVIVSGRNEIAELDENPHEERDIKEIVHHPNHNKGGLLRNDVALLVLKEQYYITSTPYINTICLRPNIPYENKRCLIAGWGKDSKSNTTTKILRKVDLPVLPHDRCQELIRKVIQKPDYVFHESLMCAGGEEGKDACKGDGGSPLVCPTGVGSTMYQVGIVAGGAGEDCGKKDVPGIYADINHLHDWIDSKLKERDI